MKKSLKYRSALSDSRRIVVKIGTRVLVSQSGRPETRRIRALVKQLAVLQQAGHEVALVTSGAIGAGMEALGMKTRPTELPDLQMAASVGQCKLMAQYDKLFSAEKCRVGQVLLTHGTFKHKVRLTNARRTMENLLRNKVIPIINENDVVSDEEIKADLALGDNDLLATLVVKLIRADLLIMLTTSNGVMNTTGTKSERIKYIESVSPATFKHVIKSSSSLSTGGMASKLKAAQTASRAGVSVVIADGKRPHVLEQIVAGRDIGTFILASVSEHS